MRYSPLLILLLAAPLLALAQSGNSATREIPYSNLEKQIKKQTAIPPRIPDKCSRSCKSLKTSINTISNDGYMVVIATVLPCDGQNYCIEETLEASRSSLPVIDSPSESIQVTPQLNATYYPSQIGAYCSLAYMQWVENGIHYSIGVKCGKREDLIALTKSAIQQR